MNHITILGDSIKKSRFNKDLADVVNKDVESRLKREIIERQNLSKNNANNSNSAYSPIPLPNEAADFVMDLEPVDFGSAKKYDDWITYWNNVKNGKIMASCAEYYIMGNSGSAKLIESLRNSFSENGCITNDIIRYDFMSLNANITSYYGSDEFKLFERRILARDYSGELLNKVLSDAQGLAYIQTLFNTTNTPDEIRYTLGRLSGKTSDDIQIWTPDSETRKTDPNRTTILSCGRDGNFHIISDSYLINAGCCYGAKYKSSKVKP